MSSERPVLVRRLPRESAGTALPPALTVRGELGPARAACTPPAWASGSEPDAAAGPDAARVVIDGWPCRLVRVDDCLPQHDTATGSGRTRLRYVANEVVHFQLGEHRYALVADVTPAAAAQEPSAAEVSAVLSNRELQIVQLICMGLLTKQVADRLALSEFTVRSYLKTIYCKLGVRSRGAMVYACAEREQRRAIELNPNYAEAHRRYGLRLMYLGRFEESEASVKRALEIDPLSAVINQQYAQLLFHEGKYDESEALSRKNVDLDANFWFAHWQLFMVLRHKRDFPMAVEALAKVQDTRGEPDAAKFIRESFAGGDWKEFLRKITADRTRLKLYPYIVATFYAELGETDKAFAALDEAVETWDQFVGQIKVDPFIDPLRGDPRYQQVLRGAGFSQ